MTYNPLTDLPGLNAKAFDIIVGSAAQVSAGMATHTVANFNDGGVIVNGNYILFLDGTHTLVRDEDITEDDVTIIGQSQEAILAFSTFTLTMSGARARIEDGLRLSGAGAGDLILSGADSVAVVSGAAYSVFALSGGAAGSIYGAPATLDENGNVMFSQLGRVLFDAGNSGAAITIDWADGPYQKLTLTAHCQISFANPNAGMHYTLLLVQDAATAFRAYLPGDVEWKDGAPVSYIAPGTVAAVELLYESGIIAARTAIGVKIADPLTLPTGTGQGIAYSPDGRYVGIAHNTTPFVSVYRRDPASGRLIYKVADPATLPTGIGKGIVWNPEGTALGMAHDTTPFVTVWEWAAGFGAKYADPATLPTGTGNEIEWNPEGTTLGVAHNTTPFVTAWQWSGAGFGAKYADPATLPTGSGLGIAWSPDGTALGVAHALSPRVTAWPWSGAGFGAKYADPATLPTGTGHSIAWSPDGTTLGMAHDTTPFVTAWQWSGAGFGAKYADPATLPTGPGNGIAWSPDGTALGVAHITTPFAAHYPSPRAARNYLGVRRI